MTKSFSRLIMLGVLGTLLVPLVTSTFSILAIGAPSLEYKVRVALLAAMAFVVALAFGPLIGKFRVPIDSNAQEQNDFLDSLSPQYIDWAIFGAAALSLFLELAVIRWQGTVFEFFAFYKNFSLLCCFAGLGLGYALADRRSIPLGFDHPHARLAIRPADRLAAWHGSLGIGEPPDTAFPRTAQHGSRLRSQFDRVSGDLLFPVGRLSSDRAGLYSHRANLRPLDAAPREAAGLRSQPARQSRWRPVDARPQLAVDAPAGMVRLLLSRDIAVLCEKAPPSDARRVFQHWERS